MDISNETLVEYKEPVWAVFGDVHAHYKRLVPALKKLGVDTKTGIIPKNLTIVQTGDLIHKGPSTNETIALVDRLINASNGNENAGAWIQLMGNHESQYFLGCVRFWKLEASSESISIMRRWQAENHLLTAYEIPQEDGIPFLLSHAGVNPFWYRQAKEVAEHYEGINVADALNFIPVERVAATGSMLSGKTNYAAGPFWAESMWEVHAQWLQTEFVPFHQIHGHVTPWIWQKSQFYPKIPQQFVSSFVLDKRKRHAFRVSNEGMVFVCIDPGMEKHADMDELHPLMLDLHGIRENPLR